MPLFFFVSGYCFKEKYVQEPCKFVWQRIKGIWWPYIKWSLLFLAFHNIFCNLNIYDNAALYTTQNVISILKRLPIKMDGHEQLLAGFWFLKALFFGCIISFVIISISKYYVNSKFNIPCRNKYSTIILIGILLLFVICLLLIYNDCPMMALPQSFLAAIFVLSGHVFRYLNIKKFNKNQIICSFVLVGIGSMTWKMAMHSVPYDISKILPYIVTGTIGTWMIYSLPWDRIKGKIADVLQFIGKNTLTILTWHFLSFKFVSLLIIFIYGLPIERLAEHPVITEYSGKGWWIAYFLFAMLATCGIAFCNRWIKSPWLKL